jgi:multidrug efflux system membrane fusion protein
LRASTAQAERYAASLDYLRRNLDHGNKLAGSGYLAKDSFDLRANYQSRWAYRKS